MGARRTFVVGTARNVRRVLDVDMAVGPHRLLRGLGQRDGQQLALGRRPRRPEALGGGIAQDTAGGTHLRDEAAEGGRGLLLGGALCGGVLREILVLWKYSAVQ